MKTKDQAHFFPTANKWPQNQLDQLPDGVETLVVVKFWTRHAEVGHISAQLDIFRLGRFGRPFGRCLPKVGGGGKGGIIITTLEVQCVRYCSLLLSFWQDIFLK